MAAHPRLMQVLQGNLSTQWQERPREVHTLQIRRQGRTTLSHFNLSLNLERLTIKDLLLGDNWLTFYIPGMKWALCPVSFCLSRLVWPWDPYESAIRNFRCQGVSGCLISKL